MAAPLDKQQTVPVTATVSRATVKLLTVGFMGQFMAFESGEREREREIERECVCVNYGKCKIQNGWNGGFTSSF